MGDVSRPDPINSDSLSPSSNIREIQEELDKIEGKLGKKEENGFVIFFTRTIPEFFASLQSTEKSKCS
jgi:hypothetical protein